MKRIMIAVSALCLASVTMPALAQEATACPTSTYQVQPGDNLWALRQTHWPELVTLNPKLANANREFVTKRGQLGIRLDIGESLCGVQKDANGELAMVNETEKTPAPAWTPAWNFVKENWSRGLIGIAALALLFAMWLLNALRKDPVLSGLPIVPDGVTTEVEARQRFARMAARQHLGHQFDILNVEPGRIQGTMMVRYRGGREEPRTVNDLSAYRATVRFSGGREEQLYMLQACGNDLRYGGIVRYIPGANFMFTPEEVRRQEPTPVAPAAEAAPAPVPAPVATPKAANEPEPAVSASPDQKVVFGYIAKTGDTRAKLTIDLNKVNVTIDGDNVATIEYLDDLATAKSPAVADEALTASASVEASLEQERRA